MILDPFRGLAYSEFTIIFVFISLVFLVPIVLVALALLVAPSEPTPEKLAPYECGFNPFSDARGIFEVKFYLIGMLFVIFDVEIAFLLPAIFAIFSLSGSEHCVFLVFYWILGMGLLLEWRYRALEF